MGTEVLHPQDCLAYGLRSVSTIFPRRKQQQSAKSCRKQARRYTQSDLHPKKTNSEDQICRSARNLVAGQVRILRRGESLDSKRNGLLRGDLRESVPLSEADVVVCGTERLGPDPKMVPKQIRLKDVTSRQSDVYAGSAFSQSPSPRSLPLPNFSSRNAVVDSATKDLRRLLRIG